MDFDSRGALGVSIIGPDSKGDLSDKWEKFSKLYKEFLKKITNGIMFALFFTFWKIQTENFGHWGETSMKLSGFLKKYEKKNFKIAN